MEHLYDSFKIYLQNTVAMQKVKSIPLGFDSFLIHTGKN